jgi:hypothetical protein
MNVNGREQFNVHLLLRRHFFWVVAPRQCVTGHSAREVETTTPFRNAGAPNTQRRGAIFQDEDFSFAAANA